jgi:hypothetical protein
MSVTIKEPFDLMALLATMKAAKEQNVGMAIWARDIQAVEDAVATIKAIRAQSSGDRGGK